MHRLSALAVAVFLAGCATPAAYTELRAAEEMLQQHITANTYVNVDLVDTGGAPEAQRAPEIARRKEQAGPCHKKYHEDFVAMLDAAGARGEDGLIYAIGRSRQLDLEYTDCIHPFGLTGYPEFKVGSRFLRTHEFVRSYWDAGLRHARAQFLVDRESSANGMAFAAGIGGAGRAAASLQPAAIQPPIICRSYAAGGQVTTMCQ